MRLYHSGGYIEKTSYKNWREKPNDFYRIKGL